MNPTGAEQAVAEPVAAAGEVRAATTMEALRRSGTAHAAGLAAATMAANLLAVVFTVVFTRLLGADGYGSLAALINLTVILLVPGAALQVAAAREGALGRLGRRGGLSATLARWERQLLLGVATVAVAAVPAREPLAALLNVDEAWAAAAVPATAGLWLLLSVQRGLLQAASAYRAVGISIGLEATGRLAASLLLVGAGLDVTGAYLGTLGAIAITAAALHVVLRRRLGPPAACTPRHPLTALARDAAVPISVLVLVAALQNVDVIVARHTLGEHAAGVYAAATVAAKALVWIAVGLGMWVLPEATRRAAEGRDPRPVLGRALALIGAIAAVALTLYALVPALVLRIAFGAEYEDADGVLLTLGAAYALLAVTYLGAQFLLGLRRRAFAAVLAAAAVAEPLLLLGASDFGDFAAIVLAVQAAAAVAIMALAARRPDQGAGRRRRPSQASASHPASESANPA